MTSAAPRRAARSLASVLPAIFVIGSSHKRRRRYFAGYATPNGSTTRWFSATMTVALAGSFLLTGAGTRVGNEVAGPARHATSRTGFSSPFSGTPRYEHLAPKKVKNASQLNRAIGRRTAAKIAKNLRLRKADTFTKKQYLEFVSGRGVGGNAADARLVDASIRILTNTTGRPLYSVVKGVITPSVLASYGLFVNVNGLLESPANADAPTRKVNAVIAPGGYLGRWCWANGATSSLLMLYRSAYTVEAIYGFASQQQSGTAQLVTNTKRGVSKKVGMSMAPAIWLTNFALIYTLNPALAADMPARWAPIPATVANAIRASPTGQIPYSKYASAFK